MMRLPEVLNKLAQSPEQVADVLVKMVNYGNYTEIIAELTRQ